MPAIKTSFNQRFKYWIGWVGGSCIFLPCKFHFDGRNLKLLNWLKTARIVAKKNIHFIKIIEDIYANFSCPLYGKKPFQSNFADLQLLKNLYQECLSKDGIPSRAKSEWICQIIISLILCDILVIYFFFFLPKSKHHPSIN